MTSYTQSKPDPPPTYQVLANVPASWFDNTLNQAVTGRKLTVRSITTGVVELVYIPQAEYTVEGVNAAVLAAIANSNAIAQLGQV